MMMMMPITLLLLPLKLSCRSLFRTHRHSLIQIMAGRIVNEMCKTAVYAIVNGDAHDDCIVFHICTLFIDPYSYFFVHK